MIKNKKNSSYIYLKPKESNFFLQDTKLPIKKVVLSTYERSVRNCPWKAELWGRYILALERYKEADDKVTGK